MLPYKDIYFPLVRLPRLKGLTVATVTIPPRQPIVTCDIAVQFMFRIRFKNLQY